MEDLSGGPGTTAISGGFNRTSYLMTAVKHLKAQLPADSFKERVGQAELMIYDRMCDGGGWNAGNGEVYSAKLWPYPDTTALALIATQENRQRKENVVSLRALD